MSVPTMLGLWAIDSAGASTETVTDPALTLPGTRVYLGEVAGEWRGRRRARDHWLVHHAERRSGSVQRRHRARAPPPQHDAALTARAVNDGLAARRLGLAAGSDAGLSVYERLGSPTLERWSC